MTDSDSSDITNSASADLPELTISFEQWLAKLTRHTPGGPASMTSRVRELWKERYLEARRLKGRLLQTPYHVKMHSIHGDEHFLMLAQSYTPVRFRIRSA